MFLTKGKILLKVHREESEIRITPIIGEFDNRELLTTFARNEEVMTQVFFATNSNNEVEANLADYFKQRGWQVEH